MKYHLKWCLLPAAILLSSCSVFAPNDRAELNSIPSSRFSIFSEEKMDKHNRWWETFQSPELNTLIDEALSNSPSIQQAWARLAQANAIAAKAGAAYYPTLNYNGTALAARDSIDKQTTETYSFGLNASYELDLWGRIKSEKQAAALDRDATREQLDTAAITISSQIALRWVGIVSQKLQSQLIHQQIVANKTSLKLIELRFRKSQSTALDVYQQRQAVANAESLVAVAELREKLLNNELTALLGRTDFQSLEIKETALPIIGALPAIGIPADVLANRPDVRQAGLSLQSADWSVSAARSDLLPAIRLTASANHSNSELSDVFDNWFANLAASLTGPIFEGGQRVAEVARVRAVANERLAVYRQTVINAIKEVEDALISEQKQREYIVALERNLELSRKSYATALNRYRKGLSEYLPVLVDLVSLQNLERDRVEAQYNLFRYRMNLYGALGGAWPQELESPFSNNEQ